MVWSSNKKKLNHILPYSLCSMFDLAIQNSRHFWRSNYMDRKFKTLIFVYSTHIYRVQIQSMHNAQLREYRAWKQQLLGHIYLSLTVPYCFAPSPFIGTFASFSPLFLNFVSHRSKSSRGCVVDVAVGFVAPFKRKSSPRGVDSILI